MKRSLFFVILGALLIAMASIVTLAKDTPVRSPNWQPILEIKDNSIKAYYDANMPLRTDEVGKGIILVVFTEAKDINTGEKIIKTKSIAKSFVVDCKTGLSMPAMELHYAVAMPTVKDKPIAAFEFDMVKENMNVSSKGSIIYSILCATQV